MLHKLQHDFAEHLFDHDKDEIIDAIAPHAIAAEKRLQVYRNNVFGNLAENLKLTFPVLLKVVGENYFDGVAQEYIKKHPPHPSHLEFFGAQLPDFLKQYAPAKDYPYFADVAALDFAMSLAYEAKNKDKLDPARLQNIPENIIQNITFQFHPAVTLLSSDYPIHKIWEFNQDTADQSTPIDLGQGGTRLITYRAGLQPLFECVSDDFYAFIKRLMDGQSLSQAAQYAYDISQTFDLSESLTKFLIMGIVTDFVQPKEGS